MAAYLVSVEVKAFAGEVEGELVARLRRDKYACMAGLLSISRQNSNQPAETSTYFCTRANTSQDQSMEEVNPNIPIGFEINNPGGGPESYPTEQIIVTGMPGAKNEGTGRYAEVCAACSDLYEPTRTRQAGPCAACQASP